MHVKAVVDITDPDLVRGEVSSSEQEPGISRPEQVWDKELSLNARYASLEPGRLILDGSYLPRPEDSAARDWEAGLVGAELSGEDGLFRAPQAAQIGFSNVGTLQACAVAFSDAAEDGVAADFTVEVLCEGVAYHKQTFTGNRKALVPLTGFRVVHPDRVRVTVTRWSLPRRRMRIAEIVPGVYEVWTEDELAQLIVKLQGDPSCLTLPYGTASIAMDDLVRRFDPRTKDGLFLMLEERQGISLYIGAELEDGTTEWKPLGTFYQANGGWRQGDNGVTVKWSLVDIVGLLAQRKFEPPATLPATLRGWLEALAGQLGENFTGRVRVDPACAELPVTYQAPEGEDSAELLSGMTCGDILRYVCLVTGTWPRADQSTGFLTAEPAWNEGGKLTLDDLTKYPVMSANQDAASVTVNGYTTDGTAPACGSTVEVDSLFTGSVDSVGQARSLLAYYGGSKIELTGRGDPSSEIGDVDAVWLAEGNAVTARRVRQELSFSGGALKNCRSTLIRGDGLFLFTRRERFLESGSWTVPEGVWRLRAVLVGHGQDGRPGSSGSWNTEGYFGPDGKWVNGQWYGDSGHDGADGAGGKVWSGVLEVNPGQVLQIQLGGGDTTLWHESSGNGKVCPNGFTDAATGEVYGRTGVEGPQPGSGDGGKGGKGGSGGRRYTQGHWYYDDGYQFNGWSEGGLGVDPDHDGPGHWEYSEAIDAYPTAGTPGKPGASGCAIICWEPPEVIEDADP